MRRGRVSKCILLVAGWSPRGFDDLATDHIEIDKPGQRSVPNVLEFAREPHDLVA